MPDISEAEGWCIFLDVFGFSAMVQENNAITNIVQELLSCHSESLEIVSSDSPFPQMMNFSDSTFLFYPVDSIEEKYSILEKVYLDISAIMSVYFKHSLPLRGGVSFGQIAWKHDMLIGVPVIRAVRAEKLCPAPLVLLLMNECAESRASITERLAPKSKVYSLSNGSKQRASLIYPNEIFEYSTFIDNMIETYLIHGPTEIKEKWAKAKVFVDEFIKEIS